MVGDWQGISLIHEIIGTDNALSGSLSCELALLRALQIECLPRSTGSEQIRSRIEYQPPINEVSYMRNKKQ